MQIIYAILLSKTMGRGVWMDANSTGLRGLLDVVKSNRLMSTGVIGFLLLMAVMAVIDGGISMMPLILATCAVGTAAVFFLAGRQLQSRYL